jgi:hypothetical protein
VGTERRTGNTYRRGVPEDLITVTYVRSPSVDGNGKHAIV